MKRETITLMLNGLADEYISEAAVFCQGSVQAPERIVHMRKKRIITFALAAALILALGAAAYAADLFGIRAVFMKNSAPSDVPDGGYVSFTQPQDVPAEMDESVRAKIDNSTQAWAEWTEWKADNGLFFPEVYAPPEGADFASEEENPDGTYTISFYAYPDDPVDAAASWEHIQQGDYSDFILLDERIATKEEHDRNMEVGDVIARGFQGYDYPYHVYTQAMADKLESIAASHGLKLRHQQTSMFQGHGSETEFSTREEITSRINEVCAGGSSFFRTEPAGYDKFYYFDEGTFAVSFYTTDDLTGTGTSCYLYNSPYGTLSSGFEIYDEVKDIGAFSTRYHTAPDGTRLTVLQSSTDIFAYAYLENSFVTLRILQPNGLTEADVDSILDMVDLGTI
ncbi:MAG: hypothetical protein Q4E20_08965 [Eubacteriales bacterium]|nr:hypothetical protein [Eubacteriales bacterium]